jgi:hypothetical protein
MTLTESLLEEARQRRERFRALFDVITSLDAQTKTLLTKHAAALKPGTSEPLYVASFLFGKVWKGCDATVVLCEMGFGEDALIVARSLLNLAINMAYIQRGGTPSELAHAFVAAGMLAHKKFRDLTLAQLTEDQRRQIVDFPGGPKSDAEWEEIKNDAKKWNDIKIQCRATRSGLDAYYDLYRYASSIEHSDAWSSRTYLDDADPMGLKVTNAPSDELVDLALVAAAWAVAVVTTLLFEAFSVSDDPDVAALQHTLSAAVALQEKE